MVSARYRCRCGADFLPNGDCSKCSRVDSGKHRHVPTVEEWARGPRAPFPSRAPRSNSARLFFGALRMIATAVAKLRKDRA